ncbi:ATP-binding cassette domain-containing protein [Homoserinibacter sp. YIM 151385]|uniref:ATP-binding cassette domain-containing protein n=1 Tax=Homoserinibacter sp. YIM 151385 TaxID=2985506 RepID=UPI003FA58591
MTDHQTSVQPAAAAGGPRPVVLAARGLAKRYGMTTALAGVNLDVAAGESLAIMGASGSGKTTCDK